MTNADEELGQVSHVYRFWGRHADLYAASDLVTFMGRPGPVRGGAVAALRLAPGSSVLEMGCGSGRNLERLREAVGPTGQVCGLDYSEHMLAASRDLVARRAWANVRLVRGDAAASVVEPGTFDGVLSVLAMSAIPRWEDALARAFEALRPGGRLAVCDARLLAGRLAGLNPLVRRIYERFAAWEPGRDIPGEIERLFGNVAVTDFNLGTFYVAVAEKTPG